MLKVDDIVRYAPGLGTDVTVVRIEGGKHDLTLSPPKARERLFTELDQWLHAGQSVGARPPAPKAEPGTEGVPEPRARTRSQP